MEDDEIGDSISNGVNGSEIDSEVSFSNHDFVIIMKCRLSM